MRSVSVILAALGSINGFILISLVWKTSKELRMLSSLHGIGFIRLDAEDPSESQIMIPAKERSDINWDTANRLTEENKDFLEYIKLIRQFYQTGEIRQSDWDMSADHD